MILRRRAKPEDGAAGSGPVAEQDVDSLFAEIDRLESQVESRGDFDSMRRLLRVRHRAGAKLVGSGASAPEYPAPSSDLPTVEVGKLPDLRPEDLTPELLRAAILRDGCAVVRGLVSRDRAAGLTAELEELFERRKRAEPDGADRDPYYDEFVPDPPYGLVERGWVKDAGGIWLADSPKLMCEILALFDRAGLDRVIEGYLGERPLITVNKSTLRRADAETSNIDWHQDGAFMGDVRTLNVWLTFSRCGDVAPGLDIVPRRIDRIVETGTPGARFDWSVSPTVAEQVAGEAGTARPIFEPGDAVLFDDYFLHATGVDSQMPQPRYAVENWFFGPSSFPTEYVPLAF